MTDLFPLLSKICYILAGAAFIAAVFLFFKFRILEVIADLSGKSAKQSIERMRSGAARSGKPRREARPPRETTSRLPKTKQYPKEPAATKIFGGKTGKTGKIDAEAIPETGLLEDRPMQAADLEATALLNGAEEATALLNGEDATALLNGSAEDATALLNGEDATSLLNESAGAPGRPPVQARPSGAKRSGGVPLTMLDEVMLVHSDLIL